MELHVVIHNSLRSFSAEAGNNKITMSFWLSHNFPNDLSVGCYFDGTLVNVLWEHGRIRIREYSVSQTLDRFSVWLIGVTGLCFLIMSRGCIIHGI